MTKDEAIQMAIEFIDEITNANGKYIYVNKTSLVADSYSMASKLKEALAQPAKEIVRKVFDIDNFDSASLDRIKFTSPQQWQGLSDDEIIIIQDNSWIIHSAEHKEFNTFKFASAIEAKLKELNT